GGNVTGATFLGSLVAAKQLSLLRDVVPGLATLGLLINPTNPSSALIARDVQVAVRLLGLKLVTADVVSESKLDEAFVRFTEHKIGGPHHRQSHFFPAKRRPVCSPRREEYIPLLLRGWRFSRRWRVDELWR